MRNIHKTALLGGAAVLAVLASASGAWAQAAPTVPAADPEAASDLDDVVVVGSHIRGARTTAALPVVVLDEAQIDATGAASGDELFRTIPQMGDVLFDASNNPQTSNAARGDVNSVNLRALGVGNTLVLLNGRRIVQHPTSQGTSDTGTVPVLSYNSNAIPVAGLRRTEILLDGAAAIYGADAVAGVVNTVLRDNFDGLTVSSRYGMAEGTSMEEFELNLFAGRNFERGNLSAFVNYTDRSALLASDQDFTRSDDLRPFFSDNPDFLNATALDGRSSNTPWARLNVGSRPVIRSNGTAVTNAAGQFRYQPAAFGCGVALANGICITSANHNFNSTNREMRYDTRVGTTVRPSVERLNVYLTGRYELDGGVEAFGEVGFYTADSEAVQPPVVNLNSIWIPASNYWNPFGPTMFADGSVNPNRLPGLTGITAAGLPVQLTSYRFVDAGFQTVKVKNDQLRLLGGLRGEWAGYDWETALLYSEAEAEDISPNINMTALQRQLALSTPDAYNPFGGGCVDTPSSGDCTASSAAAIDAIVFDLKRVSRTTLTMADLRLSRSDLFDLPGGPVGMALGVEVRHETQRDDRDANLDGTFTFVDSVTGGTNISNVSAVSPNPDTSGDRTVGSAYIEFAVPLVSPEMRLPFVHQLDVQIAGRYEHYSDFGGVSSPKIAIAWDLVEGVRLRGSYSEGFRAPNLEQTNATQYARLATNLVDHVRCEADLRAGRITNFSMCAQTPANVSLLVSGNPDLKPETSTNSSYGLVFQPVFLPPELGSVTLTFDRWRIEQEDIVGLQGAQTALTLDYLLRVGGTTNPLVNRGPVDAADTLLFAGTGLTANGDVVSVNDSFVNLLPQSVEGIDIGAYYSLEDTRFGSFEASINGTRLDVFTRDPGPLVNQLFEARAAGVINAGTVLPDPSDLIGQNGRPEWRVSTSFTWDHGPVRMGFSTQYVSSFEQPTLLGLSGLPFKVDSHMVASLYGQYEFADSTRIRLGVRDLTDEGPPLADGGYRGSVHNPWGRYWYVNVRRSF